MYFVQKPDYFFGNFLVCQVRFEMIKEWVSHKLEKLKKK